MEFIKKIKWGIYNWIWFILVIWLTTVVYWAYISITDVNSWEALTDTLFNTVLENQRVFRWEIDTLNWSISWTSIPTWAVMAFNLSTCPLGWSKANGTNGNPDLRWEFIRWLDDSRWIDVWRTLASWQVDDFKSHTHWGVFAPSWSSLGDSRQINYSSMNWATAATWWTETRPRNVALLYCVKD